LPFVLLICTIFLSSYKYGGVFGFYRDFAARKRKRLLNFLFVFLVDSGGLFCSKKTGKEFNETSPAKAYPVKFIKLSY
jgi:hypothetical protein